MTENTATTEILPVTIESELKQSYLDYAMSVIVGRALPDVRDGLKPVHRRVLYAMRELGNDWNKAYKKSARIVGDVIGKYHPHGDVAVYDTIVRMAQPFSMRYLLVDGQGNFGSVDGDSPAAMRYTEIRLSRFAHELLADLDKDTVDFALNYDETEEIPVVLPTRIPNLLVNGSAGIAVGMATNIPPHNLGEVLDALLALIENPDLTLTDLLGFIPGPDFPTAGIINGRAGIVSAYRTGRGRIVVRARTMMEVDERNGKTSIIITELPYQVNKARLLEKIGELVREKALEGITGLRDESDKDGIRVVIEVRRGDIPEVVLNNLYTQTAMQTVFGINMVALEQGQPRTLSLKELLAAFLQHRREVVTRRTLFELRKARERAHILEGLAVAIANIDPIIALIKAAKTPQIAKEALLSSSWPAGSVEVLLARTADAATRPDGLPVAYGYQAETRQYHLSPEQAQAILELRLHRLTGLETEKIHAEYEELIRAIEQCLSILGDPALLDGVVKTEFLDAKKQYNDPRRTEIIDAEHEITTEDLITEEDVVVTLSYEGYVKTQSLTSYQAQRRGGRGKAATAMKEEDVVRCLLVANTHDTVLCFSTLGKVYWLKTYQIPQASRTSRGRPIVNLLNLEAGEVITTLLPVHHFDESHFVLMATASGTVKKVPLTEFARARVGGKRAIELLENDRLVGVGITSGQDELILMSSDGHAFRFKETDVRPMSRTARGVRGMRLHAGCVLVAALIVRANTTLLTATENGYGQRTQVEHYRLMHRGAQGVRAIQTEGRNGKVVSAALVADDDEVLLITDQGTLVRTRVAEISVIGRNTQGVRLINLTDGEKLASLESIAGEPIAGELSVGEEVE